MEPGRYNMGVTGPQVWSTSSPAQPFALITFLDLGLGLHCPLYVSPSYRSSLLLRLVPHFLAAPSLSSSYVDESLTSLAMYFRNWHMFREYMNNIACQHTITIQYQPRSNSPTKLGPELSKETTTELEQTWFIELAKQSSHDRLFILQGLRLSTT